MYPPELVAPMKADLTSKGYTELFTAEDVDAALNAEGTAFVVVNSVCGCAAANARPAAVMASTNDKLPNKLVTVFAGVDSDAVNQVRKYCLPYPPSSPSMALFKNGQLVHFVERHHIEGRQADMIAENIVAAFNEFC
ncbi:MAG: putative YphP/YqiW family bacilliredoxin [Parvicella sp.]|jgi:putative YphP/YqiW family bacilliredoxin